MTEPVAERRGLARLLATSGVVTGATLAASILRGKVTAVVLGPEGLGISAEIQQLVAFVMLPLGVLSGPALITALRATDAGGRRALLAARRFTWVGGLALMPVALLSGLVLFNEGHGHAAVWLLLSASFSIALALTAVEQAALMAFQRLKEGGFLSVGQALLQAAAVAIGTWAAGLDGQFLALTLATAVMVPISIAVGRAHLPGHLRTPATEQERGFDFAFLKQSAQIGLAASVAGFASQGMWNVFRALVHHDTGATGNGLMQASRTIAVAYFGVVLQGLSAVVFPLFAAAKGPEELTETVARAVRLVLGFGPAFILGALATRRLLVAILFSGAFNESNELTGLLMASDLSKGLVWALGGALLYSGKARAYVMAELLGSGGILLCSLALYPFFGVNGIGVGHVLGYALAIAANHAVLTSSLGIRAPIRLLILGAGVMAALAVLAQLPLSLAGEAALLLAALVWFSVALIRLRRESRKR